MTALGDILLARIRAGGPMTLADYMAECLLHPGHGYYATRDPFGAKGDFITAPEISQMFGEVLGLALAQVWLDQGAPSRFTLAELGPGRGTLMADALRATRAVPGFHAAADIVLIEASATLRREQEKTLAGYSARWTNQIGELPDAPLFLIANEFFDALPIRQFIRAGKGWRERLIGERDGALAFGLGPALPVPALAHRIEDTRDGDLVELCPSAEAVIAGIDDRIAAHGGVAVILDYGDWRSLGDTLQALRGHRPEDPLANPGAADLSAHVDFEAIALAAPALRHSRLTPQGLFLERLGITERARALAARLEGDALQQHMNAHRRLTHPDEMGTLFKAIALTRNDSPPVPGFSE